MSDWKDEGYFNPYEIAAEVNSKEEKKRLVRPAATWEALRRNKSFKEDVLRVQRYIKESSVQYDWNCHENLMSFPELYHIDFRLSASPPETKACFDCIVTYPSSYKDRDFHELASEAFGETVDGFTAPEFEQSWPETPECFQDVMNDCCGSKGSLDWNFEKRLLHVLSPSHIPDGEEDGIDYKSRTKLATFLLKQSIGRVLLFPTDPLDGGDHKKSVFKEIGKKMPKPDDAKKIRFGTKLDWDAYLKNAQMIKDNEAESYRLAVIMRTRRKRSWDEELSMTTKENLSTIRDKNEAVGEQIRRRDGKTIADEILASIEKIEDFISSVYPTIDTE